MIEIYKISIKGSGDFVHISGEQMQKVYQSSTDIVELKDYYGKSIFLNRKQIKLAVRDFEVEKIEAEKEILRLGSGRIRRAMEEKPQYTREIKDFFGNLKEEFKDIRMKVNCNYYRPGIDSICVHLSDCKHNKSQEIPEKMELDLSQAPY